VTRIFRYISLPGAHSQLFETSERGFQMAE